MGQTPLFKFPWPELGDDADGPGGVKALGERAEAVLVAGGMLSYTPSWMATGSVQPSGLTTRVGRYAVDRGVCYLAVFFSFASNVVGGRGELRISLPLPQRNDIAGQTALCKTYMPGLGTLKGSCQIRNDMIGWTRLIFPRDKSTSQLGAWANTNSAGTAGTGVPAYTGGGSVRPGGNIVVTGSYLIQP